MDKPNYELRLGEMERDAPYHMPDVVIQALKEEQIKLTQRADYKTFVNEKTIEIKKNYPYLNDTFLNGMAGSMWKMMKDEEKYY